MPYTLPVQPPSRIQSHPGCDDCRNYRCWLSARDSAERQLHRGQSSTAAISWLHRYYQWGPIVWPVYWCDLIAAKDVDCGVFADLTWHILNERGVQTDRLQICERAACQETALWRKTWLESTNSASWIVSDVLVYHEALVVHREEGPSFFDPTERRPTLSTKNRLSGEPVWMRVWSSNSSNVLQHWNGTTLIPSEWTRVAGDAD